MTDDDRTADLAETLQPISRKEAKAKGLKRYFTGKPCKHGHVAERCVSDMKCAVCNNLSGKKARSKNVEHHRKRIRTWRKANRDATRAYDRARYIANRDRYRNRDKRYFESKPELRKAIQHARRARELGAEGRFTPQDIVLIRKLQKDRCAECRVALKGKGSHDHIIPLAKGGTNWPSNIQLLCKPCNTRKHAKDPIDWARENGRLL